MTSNMDYGQIKSETTGRALRTTGLMRWGAVAVAVAAIIFFASYNLTNYPLTWFDEGSHLHVPKALVRFGVYADYSSEGFRYYGPTIGVGPTVMLPIAGAFALFGTGLLQARLVMVAYLLATVLVFYLLCSRLGGRRMAWLAVLLLIASRGAGFLLYGRQVLGEVPALFFLLAGLYVWFAAWERASWWRLALAGALLGLAMVTKYQYLLFIGPALALAWLANLLYYRSVSQRVFIVPGLIAVASFVVWLYLVASLGPESARENLDALRRASAGAAFTFSPALMQQSLIVLLSFPNYGGALLPALPYGFTLALPRRREGLQWGILWLLVVSNLLWFVVASVSWWRYAFFGLALGSIFVARFFSDILSGLVLKPSALWTEITAGGSAARQPAPAPRQGQALRLSAAAWLAVIVLLPLAETTWEIVSPDFNAPQAMATYLNDNVSQDLLVETWEPELGFLTDHRYHFPPASLLADAVNQAFQDGPPVATLYQYVQDESPAYVLVGDFARAMELYPADLLASRYDSTIRIGGYELFTRRTDE